MKSSKHSTKSDKSTITIDDSSLVHLVLSTIGPYFAIFAKQFKTYCNADLSEIPADSGRGRRRFQLARVSSIDNIKWRDGVYDKLRALERIYLAKGVFDATEIGIYSKFALENFLAKNVNPYVSPSLLAYEITSRGKKFSIYGKKTQFLAFKSFFLTKIIRYRKYTEAKRMKAIQRRAETKPKAVEIWTNPKLQTFLRLKPRSLLHMGVKNCSFVNDEFKSGLTSICPDALIVFETAPGKDMLIVGVSNDLHATIKRRKLEKYAQAFEDKHLKKYEMETSDTLSRLNEFMQAVQAKYEKTPGTCKSCFDYNYEEDRQILLIYGFRVFVNQFRHECQSVLDETVAAFGGFETLVLNGKSYPLELSVLTRFNGKFFQAFMEVLINRYGRTNVVAGLKVAKYSCVIRHAPQIEQYNIHTFVQKSFFNWFSYQAVKLTTNYQMRMYERLIEPQIDPGLVYARLDRTSNVLFLLGVREHVNHFYSIIADNQMWSTDPRCSGYYVDSVAYDTDKSENGKF